MWAMAAVILQSLQYGGKIRTCKEFIKTTVIPPYPERFLMIVPGPSIVTGISSFESSYILFLRFKN
jgi:hypothetical protein